MPAELWVCNVGQIDYRSALALQERLRAARQLQLIPDTLLLLEHDPPVYTRGRRSQAGELTMGDAFYASKGIEIIDTRRGGKITYHGPGQLVGYGIVRVDDVVAYVRRLENAVVAALAPEGVSARSRPQDGPDYTGVWVEDRKIASIGVHVAKGVTMHGFAVNVDNDLTPFSWVVACGLPTVTMTSIHEETLLRPGNPRGEAVGNQTDGTSDPVGSGATSPRMIRFRTAVALAVAQALRERSRPVTLEQLESYATLVDAVEGSQIRRGVDTIRAGSTVS